MFHLLTWNIFATSAATKSIFIVNWTQGWVLSFPQAYTWSLRLHQCGQSYHGGHYHIWRFGLACSSRFAEYLSSQRPQFRPKSGSKCTHTCSGHCHCGRKFRSWQPTDTFVSTGWGQEMGCCPILVGIEEHTKKEEHAKKSKWCN